MYQSFRRANNAQGHDYQQGKLAVQMSQKVLMEDYHALKHERNVSIFPKYTGSLSNATIRIEARIVTSGHCSARWNENGS
ncbi:uncharacterized protein EAF02_007069 [Botrytis sinoallii]|uniref:uncharacterized protein n=1 Tax=Botrytis sinoallii TaxID=1463999 RepID=UPI001900239B|nr:uncharacterized protein EAF02_007069 [Botrytis sinoallii]KAF7881178.1 hypothetical protein EAF02_007069 [Botrytis sinoallii]